MGDTVSPRCEAVPPVNGTARRTTGFEHVGERPGVLQHFTVRPLPTRTGETEHRLPGWIERPDDALAIDDEKPGREAGDNLAAEALGCFGASLHCAFAVAKLADGVFHCRRHERGFGARLPIVARRGAGGGKDAQDGVGEDG
jgi:hypothetical protein